MHDGTETYSGSIDDLAAREEASVARPIARGLGTMLAQSGIAEKVPKAETADVFVDVERRADLLKTAEQFDHHVTLEGALHEQQCTDAPTLARVCLHDLRNANVEAPKYIFAPIFPRGYVTLMGGHGGSGKTTMALTFLAHAACGDSYAGYVFEPDRPMRCVFISGEDSGALIRFRLKNIAEEFDLNFDLIEKNLTVFDASDIDATLVTEVSAFGTRSLVSTQMMLQVEESVAGADFICLDNASDMYGGDENKRPSVRFFLRHLGKTARANNAALVLLAHIDKDAAKNGGQKNNYSGSTAWHNSSRSRLALLMGEGGLVLMHEKNNLGPKADPAYFAWRSCESGGAVQMPVQSNHACTSQEQIDRDAEQLIAIIDVAVGAGLRVPAAMSGSRTACHVLQSLPEFPKTFATRAGRRRLAAAVTQLIRDKRLVECEIKTSGRNKKTVLELTQKGRESMSRVRESNPHTPSAIDSRALGMREIKAMSTTHATHATDAAEKDRMFQFTFSPDTP